MMWNEYIYNGKTIRYTYNHAGDRIVKSHGDLEGVYINGAPQGITFHENDEFTLYPASIISVNKNRFTKHYFIGSQRVASRIGSGRFNNVYGRNGSYVTAGQQDYAERMSQIESQKEEYYKELGIPPGMMPTFPTANCSLTSIAAARKCRISSMVRNWMKKQACTTMVPVICSPWQVSGMEWIRWRRNILK